MKKCQNYICDFDLTQNSLSFMGYLILFCEVSPFTTQLDSFPQQSLSCKLKEEGNSCQLQEKRQAGLQLRALKRFDDSEENQDSTCLVLHCRP